MKYLGRNGLIADFLPHNCQIGNASCTILVLYILHIEKHTKHRIHGGEDAAEGEFPYIVSIRRIANAFKHM